MSSLLIKNACVVTLNERQKIIPDGTVYIEDAQIREVGAFPSSRYRAQRVLDAEGRVVLPGLINAHHHLYSSLARGFAPPGDPARNFKQILERLWWKLDAALDAEDVYYSALVALIECVKSGCTTVIDHHASPACRDGSLDVLEKAFREVGLNGCLCYEVSDRNERGAGIAENERFIRQCLQRDDDQITALFGLHASMTLGHETLERCAAIGQATATGFHVHAAEDAIDQEVAQARFKCRVVERLHAAGITGPSSIFVHGVHLNGREMDILAETRSLLVHNPESNMNNAVGVTPLLELLGKGVLVGLGTDGMASHMIASARAAYLLQRGSRGDPRVAFAEACELLLKNNRAICARIFKEPRGVLAPGALADVIIVDYAPTTPLTAATLYGHLLFGLNYARVDAVICRGRLIMNDGRLTTVDEAEICARSVERAARLWRRIK